MGSDIFICKKTGGRKPNEELTLEGLKGLITFDKSNGTGKVLCDMMGIWYATAISEGKTHEEAIYISIEGYEHQLCVIKNTLKTSEIDTPNPTALGLKKRNK